MPYKCTALTLFCSKICSNSFVKIIFNEYSTDYVFLMSQSIPTVYTPRENCFERANPGHQGDFLSNSLLRGKKLWSNLRGGAKISQTRRNSPLNWQKWLLSFLNLFKFLPGVEAKINYSYAETLLFAWLKSCSPQVEVKSRETKDNGISHLRENGPQFSYNIRRAGFYLGFFVFVGEVDLKKNFRAAQRPDNSF